MITFTNSEDLIKSQMRVKTLLDLVVGIAGLPNLLLIVSGFLLGRFQRFHSDFYIYKSFDHEYCGKRNSNSKHKHMKKKKVRFCTKLKMYWMYYSSWLTCCFRNKENIKRKVGRYKIVEKILKRKFDMRNIIIKIAHLLWTQK